MPRLLATCFTLSLEGYGAGPGQSPENPLGVGGRALHEWLFPTRASRRMHGQEGGETGVDDAFASRGVDTIGAWIMGRNMFGPVRGPWKDEAWKGWWGANPPFHTPVFVLTHHARAPVVMEGGTTFHFVTDGLEAALNEAKAAAGDRDVRLGGGVSTIREFLARRWLDELHLAIVPVLLGGGEALLAGLDLPRLGYRCVERAVSDRATHVVIAKET